MVAAATASPCPRSARAVERFAFSATSLAALVRSNRSRKRDGPLFAGRFDGRRIDDGAYWKEALRYIDLNPVRAKMCALPSDHPYSSARSYRFGEGPQWLTRSRVTGTLADFCLPERYEPRHYDHFACAVDPEVNAYLVESLVRHPDRVAPPLTDLIRAASQRQQGWMEWKAALADGTQIGTAFLPPTAARRAAHAAARVLLRGDLPAGSRTIERDLESGLLRFAAGRTLPEIAEDLGVANSTVHFALRRHAAWMEMSPRYADVVARALQSAVRRALPPRRTPLHLPPLVRA